MNESKIEEKYEKEEEHNDDDEKMLLCNLHLNWIPIFWIRIFFFLLSFWLFFFFSYFVSRLEFSLSLCSSWKQIANKRDGAWPHKFIFIVFIRSAHGRKFIFIFFFSCSVYVWMRCFVFGFVSWSFFNVHFCVFEILNALQWKQLER